MYLFPVKKMKKMLEKADIGFDFKREETGVLYKASVDKDGVKRYSIHKLEEVNGKKRWAYHTYKLEDGKYVNEKSGVYPASFNKQCK